MPFTEVHPGDKVTTGDRRVLEAKSVTPEDVTFTWPQQSPSGPKTYSMSRAEWDRLARAKAGRKTA